jgi:hypothetical protein
VLLFTPDVTEAIEWFTLTHQFTSSAGWQRVDRPIAGGLADQPAKLMEAIALVAREQNALVSRERTRRATGVRDVKRG